MSSTSSHIIIIDSEEYSGNFERELCAYVTGQIGECEIGNRIADHSKEEIEHISWWNEHIEQQIDEDDGSYRPVKIWDTPGWFNDGNGKHYKNDASENDVIQVRNQSYIDYKMTHQKPIEERIASNNFDTTGWTKEACLNYIENKKKEINAYIQTPLTKYPAYLSVAIFVDSIPPKAVLDEMIERIKEFHHPYSKKLIPFTNLRVLKNEAQRSFTEISNFPLNI